MRKITHTEALETMAMFHKITPGQLQFILEEFDYGRGDNVIKTIIEHRYELEKENRKQKSKTRIEKELNGFLGC